MNYPIFLCNTSLTQPFLLLFLLIKMKKILFAALAVLTLAVSCKKKDDTTPTPTTMQVSGTLNATSEVPTPKPTSGAGNVTGTYDPTTKVLTYAVNFSGLSAPATSGHFHFGAPGRARPSNVTIVFANVPAATSGTITGTATLTAMQADSLVANRLYVNLHTTNNPAGEIRADVVAK